MLKHTIKLALRNFMRHKNSFFINLTGLSTGLACTLLIFFWVRDEMKVDKFFGNDARLFQVMEHQDYSNGILTTISTPGPLGIALEEEIPEIELATTYMYPAKYNLKVGVEKIRAAGNYAGKNYFRIFDYPLAAGSADKILEGTNNIAISETLALSMFGAVDQAVGQSIEFEGEELYTVSGVFKDLPSNSTQQFDFLLPYEPFYEENIEWMSNWDSNSPNTAVLLKKGAEAAVVSGKIKDFIKKRVVNSKVSLFLKPYSERYLYGRYKNGKQVGGRIEYVRLFSIIALFILIIACINFMNLSTARASRRSKEVGVKKTIGANKKSLVLHFLSESILLSLFSLLVAIGLAGLALPQFNLITGKEMSLNFDPLMWIILLGVSLITGVVAGSYPAFYLSSFHPIQVLKGTLRSSLGELWVRRGLVVFQFALSFILIVAVVIVFKQIQYIQDQGPGFDKEQLVYFNRDGRLEDQANTFFTKAKTLDGIQNISSIAHNLVGQQNNTRGVDWEGKDPEMTLLFENVRVNYDLLETIGVELIEGRSFSRSFGRDSSAVVFNEKAIEIMGMENPIGQQVSIHGEDKEIIGVVRDFHFQSFRQEINPLFFQLQPEISWFMMASLEKGKEKEGLKNLKNLYEEFNPGFAFDFEFVDEQYASQYAAEQRVATLSQYFAGFAILISCLGLFGLSVFTAERRKKEIGIRKVLGASIGHILSLLTKEFAQIVLFSILIGLPVAYILSKNWLNKFVYRIDLAIWFFILAAVLMIFIAMLTVSSQAFQVARVDPKKYLRSE